MTTREVAPLVSTMQANYPPHVVIGSIHIPVASLELANTLAREFNAAHEAMLKAEREQTQKLWEDYLSHPDRELLQLAENEAKELREQVVALMKEREELLGRSEEQAKAGTEMFIRLGELRVQLEAEKKRAMQIDELAREIAEKVSLPSGPCERWGKAADALPTSEEAQAIVDRMVQQAMEGKASRSRRLLPPEVQSLKLQTRRATIQEMAEAFDQRNERVTANRVRAFLDIPPEAWGNLSEASDVTDLASYPMGEEPTCPSRWTCKTCRMVYGCRAPAGDKHGQFHFHSIPETAWVKP